MKIKICLNCQKCFPALLVIDGKLRSLYSRNFCIECSPFNGGNNSKIAPKKRRGKSGRYCPQCQKFKRHKEFYQKRNGLGYSSWCITCLRKQSTNRKKDIKIHCVNLHGGKCRVCDYNRCIKALEFHHLDPSKKDINFSRIKTLKEAIQECRKCLLVCANCHREIHDGLIQTPPKGFEPLTHTDLESAVLPIELRRQSHSI